MSYCLSPLQLIPEFIFGVFSFFDDLILFLIIFFVVAGYYLTETFWNKIKMIAGVIAKKNKFFNLCR